MSASAAPTSSEPLTAAYRSIRALSTRDAPCAGVLAHDGKGSVMLVDAAMLEAWPGWGLPAQHLAGVIDVARTASGHVAVLPWCTERADAFVARRTTASSPLGGGEAVTLGVSVLRGLCDALGSERELDGCWWLTDQARPVFFPTGGLPVGDDQSGTPIAQASAALIERAATACHDRVVARALTELADALERPRRVARDAEEWEERLFRACAPQPLATTEMAATRARDLSTSSLRWDLADPAGAEPSAWRDLIGRHVDADLGDLVGSRLRDTLGALRARFAGRRRAPWVLAAAVAGAVVLGGAVWPAAGDAGDVPAARAVPVRTPVPEASVTLESSAESSTEPGSAAEAAAFLLDALAECRVAALEGCAEALWEQPRTPPEGAIQAARRTITPIDDYGGVAVVRVEAEDGDAVPQLVVLVRTEEKWLLRDVFNVAEQPESG